MSTKPSDTHEPRYEVLWPLSRRAVNETAAAPRIPDLNDKTVCELWDVIFRGETIYPLVREHIKGRFPRVKFVGNSECRNFNGAREHHVTATLPGNRRA